MGRQFLDIMQWLLWIFTKPNDMSIDEIIAMTSNGILGYKYSRKKNVFEKNAKMLLLRYCWLYLFFCSSYNCVRKNLC